MTSQPSIRAILERVYDHGILAEKMDIGYSQIPGGTLGIDEALEKIRKRIEGLKKGKFNYMWTDAEKELFNLAIDEV